MNDLDLSEFFHALNVVALEMNSDGRFFLLADGPDWMHNFCKDIVSKECFLDPNNLFGFLDSFVGPAKEFWAKKKIGCLQSGIWIEEDQSGKECMYEAMAVRTAHQNLLVISQEQFAFAEKRTLIQTGRELALDYGELRRLEQKLLKERNSLEERVKARTAALESTNLKLARELKMRKRIEAERALILRELQQSQKMEAIGTLAGGIAHDFNNILSAVVGFTELSLTEVEPRSPAVHKMKQVLIAAERAKNLVRQILRFSRQAKEETQPIQVKQVVEETLTLLRASLPATIEICPNLESSVCVLADFTQLHQVVMNLCTNAAQAMLASGGVLTIQLSDIEVRIDSVGIPTSLNPGAYVCLTVKDTGCGIPPDVLKRIFEPFFTTKDNDAGTGMGLSVVHGIVDSQGGCVSVDSALGKGTVFHIFLPAIKEAETLRRRKESPRVKGDERILFVDDEPFQAELAMDFLGRLGYHVVAFTSSIKAIERFKELPDKFDLVITDLTMPQMTGEILAQEIHTLRPDLPIILCSGYGDAISQEKASVMGIRDYLMKPVALGDLARAIRDVLDNDKGA